MSQFLLRHSPLVVLAGLAVVLAVWSPEFFTPGNLTNVPYRTAVTGVAALGQVLVILTGGIDLSVGSVAALSAVTGARLMHDGVAPVWASVVAGVLVGLGCGLVSGLLVTRGKIPPFIVTLGMMMVARGATLLVSKGISISNLPASFAYLGGAKGWWIPVSITVVLAAAASVMLAFTRLGRALYATGGNLVSARLSGIRVDAVRITAYALCGILAGFAGVMLASRTSIASPTAAEGMELDTIAACVIGGASLSGGEGGAVGTLAGALIMNVLVNFCNLKHLDAYWQMVLVGVLIIVLVNYDNVRKRRAGVLKG